MPLLPEPRLLSRRRPGPPRIDRPRPGDRGVDGRHAAPELLGLEHRVAEATRLNTELAIAEGTRALEISPDPLNTAFASGSLGFALVEHGDPEAVVPWLERSTQMLYRFGVLRTAGWMHGYLALCRLRMGLLDEARAEGLAALETTLTTGHRWGTGRALRTLGIAAHEMGDLSEARERLTDSVATFVDFGGRLDAGIARLDIVRLAHAEGRREEVAVQLGLAHTALEGVAAPRWRERLDNGGRGGLIRIARGSGAPAS